MIANLMPKVLMAMIGFAVGFIGGWPAALGYCLGATAMLGYVAWAMARN